MTDRSNPLITASALAQILTDVTVLDVRWQLGAPSQRPAYDQGHLPGAAWVEFEAACSGEPGKDGRHPMPDRHVFEAAMREAGVRDDRPVVVYDAANSLAASRCWWLLRHFGKQDVRVLDGGYAGWVDAGLAVTDEAGSVIPGDFTATVGEIDLIDADDTARIAAEGILLDARPADRFAGHNETIDPVAGHIPGAVSAPALTNVTADGHFLPADELAARFGELGVTEDSRVGVYCGSGVQAAHLALALQIAGVAPRPEVYVGSWSHWITDPARPVAR
ncbi:sulfurtransferase [Rudaeicoccus suwonensis]|uniref:Thiosulfate/3-mercaptopyruvate sulfurtransferase n=1 Tax=Rudaeicoccus suwonensis TaxID=657409 RepID=A0A561E9T9_9MICO|nr:sulfurtransferase [Rudaeicoccus suwonensis]TWE12384.1 thiosulfate/3-mercaptopyruvate sulfurtransferase [Rudaeicoccus suwonensis]